MNVAVVVAVAVVVIIVVRIVRRICRGARFVSSSLSGPGTVGAAGSRPSNCGKIVTLALWRCMESNELKIVIVPPTLQTFPSPRVAFHPKVGPPIT